MIQRKDIYPGLRVMGYRRDINPQDAITGIVTRVNFAGEGTPHFDTYQVYVLPDKYSAPGLTPKNSIYGLINIVPDEMYLLPDEYKPKQDENRLFRPFTCEIDISKHANGENEQDRINDYFQDITSMLFLYGYDVSQAESKHQLTAKNENIRISCYSDRIDVICPQTKFEAVQLMLRQCPKYEIKKLRKEVLLPDYSHEEELTHYHQKYDSEITKTLLTTFDTNRGDEFRNIESQLRRIAANIKLNTIHNFHLEGHLYANYTYLKTKFDELVKAGMIRIKSENDKDYSNDLAQTVINVRTLEYSGELLLDKKDLSSVTDDMFFIAAATCPEIIQMFPEHLKTEKVLKSIVLGNGFAIQYVDKNLITPDICKAALNSFPNLDEPQYYGTLRYMPEASVCLEAMKELGPTVGATTLLQTFEPSVINDVIAQEAFKQDVRCIAYIPDEILFEGKPIMSNNERADIYNILNDPDCEKVFQSLATNRKTPLVMSVAVRNLPRNLIHIPNLLLTDMVIRQALITDGTAVLDIKPEKHTNDILVFALQNCKEYNMKNVDVFKLFSPELKNYENCRLAIEKSVYSIPYVPIEHMDKEMYKAAFNSCRNTNDFILLKDCRYSFIHTDILKKRIFDPLSYIQSIPIIAIDPINATEAISQNGESLRYIPPKVQSVGMIIDAIKKAGCHLLKLTNINPELRTKEVYEQAIRKDPFAYIYMPLMDITPELCLYGINLYPWEATRMEAFFPQNVKEGDNLYTFNKLVKKVIGEVPLPKLKKLYQGKQINLETVTTPKGTFLDRMVKYNKEEQKIIIKADKIWNTKSNSLKEKDNPVTHNRYKL